MTPEEKSLLERTHALAEENNEILRSLRRRARFGMIFKIAYWVVIIGISIGAFYFIQPYIDFIKGGVSDQSGNSTGYIQTLQDLLK